MNKDRLDRLSMGLIHVLNGDSSDPHNYRDHTIYHMVFTFNHGWLIDPKEASLQRASNS